MDIFYVVLGIISLPLLIFFQMDFCSFCKEIDRDNKSQIIKF